jgi:hypothetical protein
LPTKEKQGVKELAKKGEKKKETGNWELGD